MVYCGLYPADSAKYPDLRDALEKLQINDASLYFEPETSLALGFGFRCGFLGLLHLEIIQERLEREFNLDLVTTAPGVVYKVHKTNGEVIDLTNPSNLPDPSEIDYMEEPDCFRGNHGDKRLCRCNHDVMSGAARCLYQHGISGGNTCTDQIRSSVERDHLRFL